MRRFSCRFGWRPCRETWSLRRKISANIACPQMRQWLTENVPNRELHPRKDVKQLYRIGLPESTEVEER